MLFVLGMAVDKEIHRKKLIEKEKKINFNVFIKPICHQNANTFVLGWFVLLCVTLR